MKMRKNSRSDRVRWQEKRTIAKLRLERRKRMAKRGVVYVPAGVGAASVFKGTWKEEEGE